MDSVVVAQVPVFGPEFLSWIASLALAVFLVNQSMTMWKNHFREDPRPHQTYTTKTETAQISKEWRDKHDELHARIDGFEAELKEAVEKTNASREANSRRLEGKIDDLRREAKEDIRGIHRRTDAILKSVSEISGQIKNLT